MSTSTICCAEHVYVGPSTHLGNSDFPFGYLDDCTLSHTQEFKKAKRHCTDFCIHNSKQKSIIMLSIDNQLKEFRAVDPPSAEVDGIQVSLYTPKEVQQQSVVEVLYPVSQKMNIPHALGVSDISLGTTHRYMLCGTCGCNYKECIMGHTGHISLAAYVPNPVYISHIIKILSSICINCSRIRIPKNSSQFRNAMSKPDTLTAIRDACNTKKDRVWIPKVCESKEDMDKRSSIRALAKKKCISYESAEEVYEEKYREDLIGIRCKVSGNEYDVEADLYDEEVEREELEATQRSTKELLSGDTPCGTKQVEWIKYDSIFIRPVFVLTDEDYESFLDGVFEAPTFTTLDMFELLDGIREDDIEILGMNKVHARPASLLWKSLLVPPTALRQMKNSKCGGGKDDDFTNHIKKITRTNIALKELLEDTADNGINIAMYRFLPDGKNVYSLPKHAFEDYKPREYKDEIYDTYSMLYRFISVYQDSKLYSKSIRHYGRKMTSIIDVFSGKEVRNSLCGKRVDMAARSIITGCTEQHISDVGIPKQSCMNMTYPERVTLYNIRKMTKAVRNGPNVYPGAKSVIDEDGRTIDLDNDRRNMIELKLGMIVHRHLVDGDYVLMNRAPSLHKFSIMGHRIRVTYGDKKSFEIHVAVTGPYNADFDGDEMNCLPVQSEMAKAEVREIYMVTKNIIKDGVPIIGFVQNVLASAYTLTRDGTYITKGDAYQMLTQHMQWNGKVIPGIRNGMYTGKQVFSAILPSDMNMEKDGVVIKNGMLVEGRLCKNVLNGSGGIIHILCMDHGCDFTADFITGTYQLLNWYTSNICPVTVSFGDIYVPEEVLRMEEMKAKASKFINSMPAYDYLDTDKESCRLEENVCAILDQVRNVLGQRALAYLDNPQNGLITLVQSGAKGSSANIDQLCGSIGQQIVGTARLGTTCHYNHKRSDRVEGHGMCFGNFMSGTTSVGMFGHLAASREGLTGTAVKTAETGKTQRRLTKSLEDIATNVLGHVTNGLLQIVMARYGWDSMHPNKMETAKVRVFPESGRWVDMYDAPYVEQEELVNLASLRNELVECTRAGRYCETYMDVYTPIDLCRTYKNYKPTTTMQATPKQIMDWREKVVKCITKFIDHNLKLTLYLYDHLSTRTLYELGFSLETLMQIGDLIESRFWKAQIPNGEMVGVRAATYTGEQITQLTLDSFHQSGFKSHLKSGLPRINEILFTNNIKKAKNPTTPSMTIYAKDAGLGKDELEKYAKGMVQRLLSKYVVSHETKINDGNGAHFSTCLKISADIPCSLSQVVIKCRQNRTKFGFSWECTENHIMYTGSIQNEVVHCTCLTKNDKLECECSEMVIRKNPHVAKWMSKIGFDSYDTELFCQLFREYVCGTIAHGIPNMKDYMIVEEPVQVVDEETACISWSNRSVIMIEGSNLMQVMKLPWVDTRNTRTTDIVEVYDVYGICAAHELIQKELIDVIESSGASVRERHIALLSSRMCINGSIDPTTHSGVQNQRAGFIQLMSFEKSMATILDAARKGEYDPCRGPTQSIIFNRRLNGGTGIVDTKTCDIPSGLHYNIDTTVVPKIPVPPKEWLQSISVPPKIVQVENTTKRAKARRKRSEGTTSASIRKKRALDATKMATNEDCGSSSLDDGAEGCDTKKKKKRVVEKRILPLITASKRTKNSFVQNGNIMPISVYMCIPNKFNGFTNPNGNCMGFMVYNALRS